MAEARWDGKVVEIFWGVVALKFSFGSRLLCGSERVLKL
jgi:hypothetical protein